MPWAYSTDAPKNSYLQDSKNECLFYSLAGGLSFLGNNVAADKVYNQFGIMNKEDGFIPCYGDISEIIRNGFRCTFEKKIKLVVTKIKKWNVMELVRNRDEDVIYHCILINQHAVTMCDKWIFDPEMPYALQREERSIRWSAESTENQLTSELIKGVYKYTSENKKHRKSK